MVGFFLSGLVGRLVALLLEVVVKAWVGVDSDVQILH